MAFSTGSRRLRDTSLCGNSISGTLAVCMWTGTARAGGHLRCCISGLLLHGAGGQLQQARRPSTRRRRVQLRCRRIKQVAPARRATGRRSVPRL